MWFAINFWYGYVYLEHLVTYFQGGPYILQQLDKNGERLIIGSGIDYPMSIDGEMRYQWYQNILHYYW